MTPVGSPLSGPLKAGRAGSSLDRDLATLAASDLDALRTTFRKLTRRTPPPSIGRTLLLKACAWHLQARIHGGLSSDAARFLADLVRHHESSVNARLKAAAEGRPWKPRRVPDVPPVGQSGQFTEGTELVREHAGVLHRVRVTSDGFLWNGMAFGSLSQIAFVITGTRWNGHLFFGLRSKAKTTARDDVSRAGQQPRAASNNADNRIEARP